MNEHFFDRIHQYLNGKMSREEQRLFQSEMATNQELSDTFSIYQAIELEMSSNEKDKDEEAALRSSLGKLNTLYFQRGEEQNRNKQGEQNPGGSDVEEEHPAVSTQPLPLPRDRSKIISMTVWKRLAVAASLIGLVALGAIWYLQNQRNDSPVVVNNDKAKSPQVNSNKDTSSLQEGITHLDRTPSPGVAPQDKGNPDVDRNINDYSIDNARHQALYAANFEPDAAPEDQSGPLEEAFSHYESGKYKDYIAAAEQVNPNLVSRGADLTAFYTVYYKGQSYMALNNASKAIPELQKSVRNSPDTLLKAKAQWYLALAYLKTGRLKKAADLLNQVANNDRAGAYQARSAQLKKELN